MSFGQVMPLHRFETLLRCVRFSYQSEEQGQWSDPEYRWQLCEGFLDAINVHREATVTPSELLCVDESISRWYGIGGGWIAKGLLHYVAIDRKPESGCEIQNIADANGGFMLRLMLVKGADVNFGDHVQGHLNHGTNILMKLCAPWENTWRTVRADSCFASVQAAKALYEKGIHFIGVVENATRMYPMSYLGNLPMPGRFVQKALTTSMGSSRGPFDILAAMWVDRNRRYFVASTGSMDDAEAYTRARWMQTRHGPIRKNIEVKMPAVCATYFSAAGAIDQHNRLHQDDLDVEKTIETNDWSVRVNSSLLGICVSDAYLLYKGGRGTRSCIKPHKFFQLLGSQLVKNTYDVTGLQLRRPGTAANNPHFAGPPTSGVYEHLTPTRDHRKDKDGRIQKAKRQRKCRTCGMKSKWDCSGCWAKTFGEKHFCHSDTGRSCYREHLGENHNSGEVRASLQDSELEF